MSISSGELPTLDATVLHLLPLPLIVILVVWRLPAWGHRVLTFLRDLRSYRAGR
jgi:hypothetical protein